MRLRKQKEVQKENEFYMQLLQQALPPEQQMLQRQEREAEEGKTHVQKHIKYTAYYNPVGTAEKHTNGQIVDRNESWGSASTP